jgi:hypothetical protein
MIKQPPVKQELTLKFLLIFLVLTLIGLVSFGLYSSLRTIVIYQGYTITMPPNQTFKVGDMVPYVASGKKLVHIDGSVVHSMDCVSAGDIAHTIIRLNEVPTNSVIGDYELNNSSPTGGVSSYKRLKYPLTCFLENTVTFKPSPLHPDVSYTAESSFNGKLSTFQLVK